MPTPDRECEFATELDGGLPRQSRGFATAAVGEHRGLVVSAMSCRPGPAAVEGASRVYADLRLRRHRGLGHPAGDKAWMLQSSMFT